MRVGRWCLAIAAVLGVAGSAGCKRGQSTTTATPTTRPSILLVTLDTTRADAIGPEAVGIETPAFNAIAARGRRFRQAYATVPETLPSHASMMTGLYPAGHGVHENARYLSAAQSVIAERLRQAGYRTAAFVSSFVLAKPFGLARGFDIYDDAFAEGRSERTASETTEAALRGMPQGRSSAPMFVWVHYNDPHAPYTPPEPFASHYVRHPYLGEVAAMDEQLGALVRAFEQLTRPNTAIIIAADHGEGLGDHGEAQHGNLIFNSTMHVPLVIVGPGVQPGVSDTPVSTRQIFFTILDWAGLGADHSLRPARPEVVLGEAMKPFLEYGWQPQVMAVDGRQKVVEAGKLESYDVIADPVEAHNLGAGANVPQRIRKELEDYPTPLPGAARPPDNLDADAKQRLASLGYVSAGSAPVVRSDAPRPADMVGLLATIDLASGLFVSGRYAQAIPVLEKILAADPHNVDAALRLAVAHSSLGHNRGALEAFRRAAAIAPNSQDVQTYLGLHYVRVKDWDRAVPMLEQVVNEAPDRLPAVEGLATARVGQGERAMDAGRTAEAITDFERARALRPSAFRDDLELGVLYLAAHRFEEARAALDRALSAHPDDPMVLFKRAQVSVLLHEPDQTVRIDLARKKADATTRPLIERERLFKR